MIEHRYASDSWLTGKTLWASRDKETNKQKGLKVRSLLSVLLLFYSGMHFI